MLPNNVFREIRNYHGREGAEETPLSPPTYLTLPQTPKGPTVTGLTALDFSLLPYW